MLKFILIALALAVAVVVVLAASKPDEFRVVRSARIAAPPEKIFPLINDLKAFQSWSPFEKMDPAMKHTYNGPEAGPGAAVAWEGNSQAGAGSFEITESVPSSRVTMNLHMIKPIEAHNRVVFTLQPEGGNTLVTWDMSGKNGFLPKLMGLFFNMDKMVGGEFENGLASLKAMAEKT